MLEYKKLDREIEDDNSHLSSRFASCDQFRQNEDSLERSMRVDVEGSNETLPLLFLDVNSTTTPTNTANICFSVAAAYYLIISNCLLSFV